ncbi:MAG TPA: S8 family serine peptidase [Longimicrobium sp.]|nr:S8 family serine peptidase [Longimicrobium sp.]
MLSVLAACKDLPTDSAPAPKPIQNLVGCRVEVATGHTVCEPLSPDGKPVGASLNVIADAQWMVQTEAGAYTPADSTYRFNLRVTNDTEETLGTIDGTQATGLKVFLPVRVMGYARQPGNTSDPYGILIPPIQNTNNTVHARNPDGIASFTAADQPYWHYPEMLQPWETTGWKEWQFTVDPGVAYFYFAVSIFTHAAGEQPVASTAPDGWLIPADSVDEMFATPNLIMVHSRMSGPYPRNLVMLTFAPGATQDEKQAAVDHVGGTLVGGNGAHYYVRVSSGSEPVWWAIDRLAALPQVEHVMPFITGLTITYHRPNNGPGWEKKDWEVHPDSSRGRNWAPEAIAAPSAWGCELGSSAIRIVVADIEAQHGRIVGSIISNPGDAGSGVAGIAWGTSVSVYNASIGSGTIMQNLYNDLKKAIQVDRAHVINMSLASRYVDSLGNDRLPIPGAANDIARAQNTATALRTALMAYEAGALPVHHPLYVIAAGNYQVDASYSGFPQLATGALALRVIVVAAHDSARAGSTRAMWANSGIPLAPGSSIGSLPSIAAPGASLHIRTSAGDSTYNGMGTSYAAPHVAGIAGLLFSQVPSRTAETVRTYVLEGASRGGRTAGGYPIANAYQSLKRGAENTGAPLCGNRVWAEGAQIYAQRGSGKEAIGPAESGAQVGDILTQHGGRVILYNNSNAQGRALHRQADGTWALGTIPADYNAKIGGATWSERAYAHAADSLVGLATGTLNNNQWWRTGSQVQVPVMLRYLQNGVTTDKQLGTLTVQDLPQPETSICVERTSGGFCTYRQYSGRYWVTRVAYPQAYQPVLIAVTPLDLAFADSTPWVTCTRDPSLQCRTSRSDYRWSHTRVYRMPLTGGTPTLVDSLPKPVLWMGQSEAPGSDSLVMGSGRWIVESVFDPNIRASTTTRSEVEGCGIQYRSLGTLATVAHDIVNPITCDFASLTGAANHGLGTFAPVRAPEPSGGGSAPAPGEMRVRIEDLMPQDGTRRAQRPRR